ncbi:MAG: glycosyltransferase [Paludibacteraceae bacterium]|nr:glycosyltransferase [Paludibacteraceae bacterium]
MSKISIAIATYNGAKYLREQLDSLYRQTRVPDEVVVSDDCSTDSTRAILEEYHQSHGLIYIANEHNLGFNRNFENALMHTTGDYVLICDQDDIWFDNKVETLYNTIIKYDASKPAAVSSTTIDYVDGVPTRDHTTPRLTWKHMLQGHGCQGCCAILNRALLDKVLPLNLPKGMMYDAYIGFVACMLGNWENIGTPLMYYRHHSSNVIANLNAPTDRKDQYPAIIAPGRFDLMRLLRERFGSEFRSERVAMFDEMAKLEYRHSKISRIFALFKLNKISKITRIKTAVKIFIQ